MYRDVRDEVPEQTRRWFLHLLLHTIAWSAFQTPVRGIKKVLELLGVMYIIQSKNLSPNWYFGHYYIYIILDFLDDIGIGSYVSDVSLFYVWRKSLSDRSLAWVRLSYGRVSMSSCSHTCWAVLRSRKDVASEDLIVGLKIIKVY